MRQHFMTDDHKSVSNFTICSSVQRSQNMLTAGQKACWVLVLKVSQCLICDKNWHFYLLFFFIPTLLEVTLPTLSSPTSHPLFSQSPTPLSRIHSVPQRILCTDQCSFDSTREFFCFFYVLKFLKFSLKLYFLKSSKSMHIVWPIAFSSQYQVFI